MLHATVYTYPTATLDLGLYCGYENYNPQEEENNNGVIFPNDSLQVSRVNQVVDGLCR